MRLKFLKLQRGLSHRHVLSPVSQSHDLFQRPVFLRSAYIPLNNYLVFNDVDGLYTYSFEAERKVGRLCSDAPPPLQKSNRFLSAPRQENCSACSQVPQDLQFPSSAKLQEILEYLTENSALWVSLGPAEMMSDQVDTSGFFSTQQKNKSPHSDSGDAGRCWRFTWKKS